MAHIRRRKSGSFEITIRHRLLPRPLFASADTEAQARAWAERIEASLAAGIIPVEVETDRAATHWSVTRWIEDYRATATPSPSDLPLLDVVARDFGRHDIGAITVKHLEDWIGQMKLRKLTPGSIKKRVGALGRALDIALCRDRIKVNPVRGLPRNYAAYTQADGDRIEDTARDRRLEHGEEARLRAILDGRPEWMLLFELALETAMRLSELYTLEVGQIDLGQRTIFLDRTKNGDRRQVPLSSVAQAKLQAIPDSGLLFPFYCGNRAKTTARLSYHWAQIAKKAGCADLHFHDLRHEATCRLFERTRLSDLQISLITGHRDPRMLKRYANLRGSTLADQLW